MTPMISQATTATIPLASSAQVGKRKPFPMESMISQQIRDL